MPELRQNTSQYRTLGAIVDSAARLNGVRRSDLTLGDQLLVTTKNSIYTIHVLQEGLYSVSGGWFDRRGESPSTVTINGCTWGGRAIKPDIVAACGLHLEFGNQVVTTRILKYQVIRCREDSIN
jgi:hypothetical protein